MVREDDGWHARWRAIGFDNYWVDEYVRSSVMTTLTEDAEDQRHETLHDAWLMALKSATGLVRWDESECAAFAADLETWSSRLDCEKLVFTFHSDESGFSLTTAMPHTRGEFKSLGEATYVVGVLRGLKRDGEILRVQLARGEAEDFLHRGARELRLAGYEVVGVDLAAEVSADLEIGAEGDSAAPTRKGKPPIKLTVRVAGEAVSIQEIKFLLDQGSSLVFFREHWIEVDRNILKQALRALERGVDKKVNPISFALGLGHIGFLELQNVKAHGWIRGLVNELRQNAAPSEGSAAFVAPKGFKGELREYQAHGALWLDWMTSHGFGALLADDMGLGKTVQTIAWAMRTRKARKGPLLIVAPLTLLANWRHEFNEFAPEFKVYSHHGGERRLASGFRIAVSEADVTLTSYTLLVRDYSLFSEIEWESMVLDEAQVIKNPETQISNAVKALAPSRRIALTGTPIENTIGDLWSIEEYLNPGFLGERKEFERRFVRPLADNPESAVRERLKHALEPFVLRRLKSDSKIAAELGEKREIREYCALSSAQRLEYERALADFRATLSDRGDIFALLTELKLICDGFGISGDGGKLDRLTDLLTQIFESGESALVFTQFAKVGEWLKRELESRFKCEIPFLHGALSAVQREREIEKFNSGRAPKAFILSLKAGGFGLNLTKATHVIHFDRWWNPAVENQATDRAHRIGQTKTVFVHLFITEGTLEERIDRMLVRKEGLKELLKDGEEFFRNAVLT